ncbi:hypothetical protein [Nakamurella endophytica]|uniref:Uncharacterized protein n=1 Tax=Nakamurella endophytica TaxID=1748367 RepID=A0A917TCR3_9ACTN|nr:hypothetical protein [Nakamurella endophytica]GGM18794.1 hypothetical protein GCM10011594_43600 [Nakamurella endophytica]
MQAYTSAGQWRALDNCQGRLRPLQQTGESALAMSVGQTLTIFVIDQPDIQLSVTPVSLVRLDGRVITAEAVGDILIFIHGSHDLCPPQPPAAAADSCPAMKVTIVG